MQSHTTRVYFEMLRWQLSSHDALEASRPIQKLLHTLHAEPMAEFWHRVRRLDLAERLILERAVSNGQIESKLHLVEALCAVLPARPYNVCILASWVGILGRLLNWLAPQLVGRLVLVDVDPEATALAAQLHLDLIESERMEIICADANTFRGAADFDLIINCGCEHFSDYRWFENIRPGCIVALQSTNASWEPDHIRCAQSLREFQQQFPLDFVLYGDETPLIGSARYTLLGQK